MIDHIGLLPAYIAAGTATLALLIDLAAPGRWRLPVIAGVLGALATAAAAVYAGSGDPRASFCLLGGGCSYQADTLTALIGVLFAVLTAGSLALSVPILRDKIVPSGEYCFLLACSMTGGVMLGGARDLIMVIVAVETVTIPLYVLVGMRREMRAAEASLTFFITSVVATSVALLGAGLLYAATGTVSVERLGKALTAADAIEGVSTLVPVGIVLLLAGLAVKVAAVPVHAWAAPTYDGAPLPVTAFLSTASKLAGITSVVIVISALNTRLDVVGPTLAIIAAATMTVGNLVALRQRRMVRLLAWSSIAQGGYLLAPLGALALSGADMSALIGATVAYSVFFILLEFGAFGSLIAVRGTRDGGDIVAYQGIARKSWWVGSALVLAITGLAGLPPGIAGLFAKVVVLRALVDAGGTWLAVVVALNAVIGLAYYARLVSALFAKPEPEPAERETIPSTPRPAGVASSAVISGAVAVLSSPVRLSDPPMTPRIQGNLAVILVTATVTILGVAAGFLPEVVIDIAKNAAEVLP